MEIANETAPGGARLDEEISLLGGLDNRDNGKNHAATQAQNPRAVREAKLELLREAVHEACGFIRLHAEACQPLVEAGDDAGLLHSLGRLVIYTKHAARVGNELRELRKDGGR